MSSSLQATGWRPSVVSSARCIWFCSRVQAFKTKTKTLKMHLETISRPSHVLILPISDSKCLTFTFIQYRYVICINCIKTKSYVRSLHTNHINYTLHVAFFPALLQLLVQCSVFHFPLTFFVCAFVTFYNKYLVSCKYKVPMVRIPTAWNLAIFAGMMQNNQIFKQYSFLFVALFWLCISNFYSQFSLLIVKYAAVWNHNLSSLFLSVFTFGTTSDDNTHIIYAIKVQNWQCVKCKINYKKFCSWHKAGVIYLLVSHFKHCPWVQV